MSHFSSVAIGMMASFLLVAPCALANETQAPPAAEDPPASAEEHQPPAIVPPPAVVGDIRSLFAIQDAAALGTPEASDMQTLMIGQINESLRKQDLAAVSQRLAILTAGFILSGGDPALADHIAEAPALHPSDRKLLKGAAAYMLGDPDAARQAFADLDPLAVDPEIAGRVALALAILSDEDSQKAQDFLSLAALSMPGSLVEEGALRRSVLAFAAAGKQPQFWRSAFRYQRRFADSLYAPQFIETVTMATVAMDGREHRLQRGSLDRFLNAIPIAERRKLLVGLCHAATLQRGAELAGFAGARLVRLSSPGSQESQIGELYRLLAEISDPESVESRVRLQSIDAMLLPSPERLLLDAALRVSSDIDAPLTAVAAGDEEPVKDRPWAKRSGAALADAEKLLAEAE